MFISMYLQIGILGCFMAKKTGRSEKTRIGKATKKDQHMSGVWKMATVGGEEKLNITIRVNKQVAEAFKALCEKRGASISKVVEAFFKNELSK